MRLFPNKRSRTLFAKCIIGCFHISLSPDGEPFFMGFFRFLKIAGFSLGFPLIKPCIIVYILLHIIEKI